MTLKSFLLPVSLYVVFGILSVTREGTPLLVLMTVPSYEQTEAVTSGAALGEVVDPNGTWFTRWVGAFEADSELQWLPSVASPCFLYSISSGVGFLCREKRFLVYR